MEDRRTLHYNQIAEFMHTEGAIECAMAGEHIQFDLRFRHERAYAAKCLLNVRYPQSDIDSFLFERFLKPGDKVLDAGAHVGFTALECLTHGASQVLALEPLPELFERLKKLSSEKIIPLNNAISSSPGYADLYVSSAHNQGSSINKEMLSFFPEIFDPTAQKVSVPLTTIDDLSEKFGACNVWKLDVEGAETDALIGASKILQTNPPRVIIVELYEKFFEPFYQIVKRTHPHAYRAFICKQHYKLELRDVLSQKSDDTYSTSPMYVFMRAPCEKI